MKKFAVAALACLITVGAFAQDSTSKMKTKHHHMKKHKSAMKDTSSKM